MRDPGNEVVSESVLVHAFSIQMSVEGNQEWIWVFPSVTTYYCCKVLAPTFEPKTCEAFNGLFQRSTSQTDERFENSDLV